MHVYRITSKYHRFNINSFFLVRYFYIFVCFLHSISVSVRMPTSNFVSFSFFFDRYFCNCARTNDSRVPPVLFHLLWPMCKMCIFFLFSSQKRESLCWKFGNAFFSMQFSAYDFRILHTFAGHLDLVILYLYISVESRTNLRWDFVCIHLSAMQSWLLVYTWRWFSIWNRFYLWVWVALYIVHGGIVHTQRWEIFVRANEIRIQYP